MTVQKVGCPVYAQYEKVACPYKMTVQKVARPYQFFRLRIPKIIGHSLIENVSWEPHRPFLQNCKPMVKFSTLHLPLNCYLLQLYARSIRA